MITLQWPARTTANLEVVTRAELETFLDDQGTTADQTRLDQIVDGINDQLYDHLRRRFIKQQADPFELILDGPADARTLIVPHKPINSITNLERGYYQTSGWVTDHTFDASEYVLENDAGRIRLIGTSWFFTTKQSVKIEYASGFATIPASLKKVVLQLMATEYRRAAGKRIDHVSQAVETGATSYTFDTMPANGRAILGRYMRKDGLL